MKYLLSHEVRVGVMTVCTVLLLAFMAWKLKEGIAQSEGYEIIVVFPNTGGLRTQASVRMSGVKIGEVTEIFLRPDNLVNVTVRIQNKVRIPKQSNFRIATQSLLAFDTYIEVVPPEKPLYGFLANGATVEGLPPLGAQEIMEGVFHTMKTFDKLSKTLSELLEDRKLIRGIKEAMLNVSEATAALKVFVQGAAEIMTTHRPELEQALTDMATTLRNGKEISYRLRQAIRTGRLEELQNNLNDLLKQLKTTSEKANELLDKMNKEVLSSKNTEHISSMLQEGDETLKKLSKVQKQIAHLKMSLELESGYRPESNLVDQNAYFRIEDSKKKLFLRSGVMHIGEGSKLVLQGGRKRGDLSLYGGIKENKIGIGAALEGKHAFGFFDLYDPNDFKWELKTGYKIFPHFSLITGLVKDTKRTDEELWFGIRVK